MKLEDQVCGLELAKKLKDFGMKQESLFYWFEHKHRGKYPEHENDFALSDQADDNYYPTGEEEYWYRYSAFTVAELGLLLPAYCYTRTAPEHADKRWLCAKIEESKDDSFPDTMSYWELAETEADARAKMLIYLIEQGIIKP